MMKCIHGHNKIDCLECNGSDFDMREFMGPPPIKESNEHIPNPDLAGLRKAIVELRESHENAINEIRIELGDLQHVIAGATVAIVAGQIYAAMAVKDPEFSVVDAAVIARNIMEEVGNV